MSRIENKYEKVIFVEFSARNTIPKGLEKEFEKYWSSALVAMLRSGHFPQFEGKYQLDETNVRATDENRLGGWIQALLPHIESFVPCEYMSVDPTNTFESIKHLSNLIGENPSIVLISFASVHVGPASSLIGSARRMDIPAYFIVGGVHASADPQETLKATNADVIVCGEADHILFPLIESLFKGQHFRHQSVSYYTEPREVKPSLALIRDRAYSWSLYRRHASGINRKIPRIVIDRYCQNRCGFCSLIPTKKSLPRLAEKAMKWMLDFLIQMDLSSAHLKIADPDFDFMSYDETGLIDFFHSNKLTWDAQSRVRKVTPSLKGCLERCRASGCLSVFVGVESFQQHVLDLCGKHVSFSDIIPYLTALKTEGIATLIALIVGLPGQTTDDVEKDIDTVCELIDRDILDVVFPQFLVLYPRTRFKNDPGRYGITILDSSYDGLEISIQHCTQQMSKDDIMKRYVKMLQMITEAHWKRWGGEYHGQRN